MMMVMMTVGVWWGDSEVVVMERMSGGAWSRGSDRSIDEEYIWSSPERVAGKLFRRCQNEEEHLNHLEKVLQVMKEHSLFAKMSKCHFGVNKVEYLGHFITSEGVVTDPTKIEAMVNWPVPQTVKQLRGFLGLTGYYRRFIRHYAILSKPLTRLLKKNAFEWDESAQIAFTELKQAMTQTPVLALPNFQKTFTVETDASGLGIGAVLQQEGHPIAYLSKTLSSKHQSLSTYEKEFLAVLLAVDKWRGYLMDRHFKIKTDHFSLKYLLDQRLTTPFQAKWLPKLLGFDYEISYKKGSENIVADALSRVEGSAELNSLILSTITSDLLQKVKDSYVQDSGIQEKIKQLIDGTYSGNKYTWEGAILKRKGKVVVGGDEMLRTTIIKHFHADAIGGHSGTNVTGHKIGTLFYWKGMHKGVKKFIRECDVCQKQKPDLCAYPGLLQPLPIPERVWSEISMDFIVGLPKSQGNHPYTASSVAQVFFGYVYKIHDSKSSIVLYRDAIFLSNFWKSLFKLLKVELKMSTAYHPQTDGQTKVVNKCLECFLRCMSGERPKEWVQWLPLAEFWYNTNKHSSINVTPFEVVYGQTPPLHTPYLAGESAVEVVDRTLQAREAAIEMLKFHLKRSQDKMKISRQNEGLRENLRGNANKMGILPHCGTDGLLSVEPEAILDRRIAKLNNKAAVYVLVKWATQNEENATWELYDDLVQRNEVYGYSQQPHDYLHNIEERVGGNKNKGWKLWKSPSAGCASSASSSTKGVKNENGGRLSTSGSADVELLFTVAALLWLELNQRILWLLRKNGMLFVFNLFSALFWLDVGEGKEVDLKECPRSKLRKLYAGEKKKGKFHHSSFLAGGATLAAGRLDVDNGTLEVCVPIREIANGGISLQK
ncbi:putative mitochondrial protein [Tanacetum coccineum]|uniref:Mitochondrial protein n=1 Tax=Tanacetum coccineum TaxID=301880 RepID=A0ABQ4YCB2_9ASTR